MGPISRQEGDQINEVLKRGCSSEYLFALRQFIQSPFNHDSKILNELETIGLVPSAAAFGLAHAIPKSPHRPILIVTDSSANAEKFYQDLQFFFSEDPSVHVFHYPVVDVSPYVPSSPNLEITAQRLECLYTLATYSNRPLEHIIVVAPIRSLMNKVIDSHSLLAGVQRVAKGDEFDRELLIQHLLEVGYIKNDLVEERGSFAVRGAILDLYPPLLNYPIRLEFFGDEIESIRSFNPENQKTFKKEENSNQDFLILPVRETFQNDFSIARARSELKARMDEAGISKSERQRISELLSQHIFFPGIEHYLPLFNPNLVSPIAYFPKDVGVQILLNSKKVLDEYYSNQKEIYRCYEEAVNELHPLSIVPPAERFALSKNHPSQKEMKKKIFFPWFEEDFSWKTIRFENLEVLEAPNKSDSKTQSLRVVSKSHDSLKEEMAKARAGVGEPLTPLLKRFQDYQERGYRVGIVCDRRTGAKRLMEMLRQHEIPVRLEESAGKFFQKEIGKKSNKEKDQRAEIVILLGQISGGFLLPGEELALISDEEIFGTRTKRTHTKPFYQDPTTSLISAFSELQENDYVVHLDFGIARYLGLAHMEFGGVKNDFLILEYKSGDKLYLPIHRLSRIQKYVGGESNQISLDRLGNTASWEKTKERVRRRIKEIAKDLLELYASRQVLKGHGFDQPDEYYRKFEAEFPFEETPDQLRSIEEVLSDMIAKKPMDRLICGDVGYGKTEVAIRAIFLAVMNGFQAALLAPTTVLVHQHFLTLKKRFEGYPVTIQMMSRFASKKEQQETIAGIRQGKVDIVVGTHRLLYPDLHFKKLGLLVVDEEQRFGVKHKERIKLLKKNVDVLTLTATPIPRTLNMAMIGIRDLSVINTPPLDRVSIRTFVAEFDDRVIREAILREIQRGGQVYFVHNRVHNIGQMAQYLEELVPESRIGVGHGQMNEAALEKVMVDFVNQQYDVLLSTSIIESGLDIPSVNSIIINRADHFGLSQLYQLRGRVGRSNKRAYAYFLIPGRYLISENAQKRLEVLQKNTELGSGFRIASYDMEIRGAGNLLGRDQSGHIGAVGLEMYADLMKKAMRELKGERIQEEIDSEIDLRIPAFIPEDYILEDRLRLGTYKRLSMMTSDEEVEEMEQELKDRFGPLPREVKNLLKVIEIKALAQKAFVKKLIFGGSSTTLSFDERTPVEVDHLLHLVNTHKNWKLLPDNRLTIASPTRDDGAIPFDRESRVLKETRLILEKLLKNSQSEKS